MTEETQTSDLMMAGTVDSVRRFLEVKIKKHELAENVGNPILTATKRMLDVGDDVPNLPVRDLDFEELFNRFRNKNAEDLTDGSAQAYQSRFRRAQLMYVRWLDGDSTWSNTRVPRAGSANRDGKRPTPSNSNSNSNSNRRVRTHNKDVYDEPQAAAREDKTDGNTASSVPDAGSARPHTTGLFEYPVLLDSGDTAILRLPARYNTRDAMRMKALIDALARDEQPANSE